MWCDGIDGLTRMRLMGFDVSNAVRPLCGAGMACQFAEEQAPLYTGFLLNIPSPGRLV